APSRIYSSVPTGHHHHLPSFPTRRSSDLSRRGFRRDVPAPQRAEARNRHRAVGHRLDGALSRRDGIEPARAGCHDADSELLLVRSEEHTSELQSLTNLVFRLLLEKKNKTN